MLFSHRLIVVLLFVLLSSSTGRGQGTWKQVPTALPSNPDTHISVGGLWGIAMADSGTGYAAGYASVVNGFSGVLKKSPGNPTWFVLPSSSFSGLPNNHSLWSAVTVVGGNIWVCGSNGRIYRSTNHGSSWTSATSGITGSNTLFDIFFKNANEGMVVGSNGTMYYSSDGGSSWTQQTLPASVPAGTSLYGVHSAGTNWYVSGGVATLIRGTPTTNSWTDVSSNLPSNIGIIEGLQFLDNTTGTIGGVVVTGQPVHRTTNGGGSFSGIGSGLPLTPIGIYNTVFFHDVNNGWTGNAWNQLYWTSNGGSNWTQSTTTALPSQSLQNYLTRISFSSNTSGHACGGAPGTSSTGWILRYVPPTDPIISSSNSALDFGLFECALFTDRQYTIRNTGFSSLSISSITFTSANITYVGATLPPPIAPGDSAVITIRWTPSQGGPMPAGQQMTINSNDPLNPAWVVALSGSHNRSRITLGGSFPFPETCVGDSSEITINAVRSGNVDPVIVSFEHVSGDDAFELVFPAVGSTVPGQPTFLFRFKPGSNGSKAGRYRLLSGLPACPEESILDFSGDVRSTAVSLSQQVVDFGDVCLDDRSDLTVTVVNTGTTQAVITNRILLSGKDVFPNQHPSPFGPVPVGQSGQYKLRFAPTQQDTGLIEATYGLILAPCRDTVRITLRGRGVRTGGVFNPTNLLILGPVPVGQTAQSLVTFTNDGTAALTVTGMTLNPPNPRLTMTGGPSLPRVIQPGQSVAVTVRFDPDRIEVLAARLCVQWSDPCADSACLPVTATSADRATIVVDGDGDFGIQRCDGPVFDTLMIRNSGTGPLSISGFQIEGSGKAYFSVVSPSTPLSIPGGGSRAVILSFDRATQGSSSAELRIHHNDIASGTPTVVPLSGERSLTSFVVDGDSTSVMSSCADIGSHRTFFILNNGLEAIDITDISVQSGGPEFSVASTPLPATVQPGSSISFEVSFTPTAKGTYDGSIVIAGVPCDLRWLLSLRGSGSESELAFTPDPVDFGTVNIGSTDTRDIRVRNNGGTAVTVSDILISPALPSLSITAAPNTPFVLNAGGERVVTVRYAPTLLEDASTALCVIVSTPCPDTICVPMRARSSTEGLALNRGRLTFDVSPCGSEAACDTVVLHNGTQGPVDITAMDFSQPGWFFLSPAPTLPFTLQAGADRVLTVCANPGFVGSRNGNLTIRHSDAGTPNLLLDLSANRDSSGVRVLQQRLDFGSIASCERGRSLSVTVENIGSMMELVSLTSGSTGAFTSPTTLPMALQPGQSRQITVAFTPATYGVYDDTLFVTTSRCAYRYPVRTTGNFYEENYTVTPDPLLFSDVSVGSSEIRNFVFENVHLRSVRIADVIISPAGPFASWGAYPKVVGQSATVNLPILYTPTGAGTDRATACIIVDQPCPDTICVALEGTAREGALVLLPASLDFGTQYQCQTAVLSDTVRNSGTITVALLSATVQGSAAFVLDNPLASPLTLAPGEEHVFFLRFGAAAATDGDNSAELVITTDDSVQPELRLLLGALRETVDMPPTASLDFGSVITGQQQNGDITITNNGTAPFTYASAMLPAQVSGIAPALPQTLQPGERRTFTITYTPDGEGPQTLRFGLRSGTPCADSTLVTLTADVKGGLVFDRPVDMGTIPACFMGADTVYLENDSPLQYTIYGLTLDGADAARFTVAEPQSFPRDLQPGDRLRVIVLFQPDPLSPAGSYSARLRAQYTIDPGVLFIDTPVSAEAIDASLTLAAPIDFGDASLNQSTTRSFTLTNNTPFSLSVSGMSMTSAVFSIESVVPALPRIVHPGQSLVVTISFTPTEERDYSDDLTVSYYEPCAGDEELAVTGRGVDNDLIGTLRAGEISGAVDDMVLLPVYLDTDLSGVGVRSWAGSLRFDRSMLHPVELRTEGTLSSGMTVAMDGSGDEVLMSADGADLGSGTGVLVYVYCKVLIGSAGSTDITIGEDFDVTSGAARIEVRTAGRFTLTDYCEAGGTRFVQSPRATMQAGTPNPFTGSTRLRFTISGDAQVSLQVFDDRGRSVAVLVNGRLAGGEHSVRFDAHALPPGLYFAVLSTGGTSIVRKLVLLR